MALRSRWNCQSPASSAITRTKLSVKPITAMPPTIIAAPKRTPPGVCPHPSLRHAPRAKPAYTRRAPR